MFSNLWLQYLLYMNTVHVCVYFKNQIFSTMNIKALLQSDGGIGVPKKPKLFT